MEKDQGKKITQIVIESIQDKILNGELKSGDKLPAERQLSEQLGISRHTLREGLSALAVIGVIDSTQGGGNYITHETLDGINSPLSMLYTLGGGSFEDVVFCRIMIEIQTMKYLCAADNEIDYSLLKDIIDRTRKAGTINELIMLDLDFHKELIFLGDNLLMKYFFSAILSLIEIEIEEAYRDDLETPELNHETYVNHKAIVENLENRNVVSAIEELIFGYSISWPDIDFKKVKAFY